LSVLNPFFQNPGGSTYFAQGDQIERAWAAASEAGKREGVKYAIEEYTEPRLLIVNPPPSSSVRS
jgi:hypothetical protein